MGHEAGQAAFGKIDTAIRVAIAAQLHAGCGRLVDGGGAMDAPILRSDDHRSTLIVIGKVELARRAALRRAGVYGGAACIVFVGVAGDGPKDTERPIRGERAPRRNPVA